jgi:hypothetical protein
MLATTLRMSEKSNGLFSNGNSLTCPGLTMLQLMHQPTPCTKTTQGEVACLIVVRRAPDLVCSSTYRLQSHMPFWTFSNLTVCCLYSHGRRRQFHSPCSSTSSLSSPKQQLKLQLTHLPASDGPRLKTTSASPSIPIPPTLRSLLLLFEASLEFRSTVRVYVLPARMSQQVLPIIKSRTTSGSQRGAVTIQRWRRSTACAEDISFQYAEKIGRACLCRFLV